jgi:hypothetical protein
MLYNSQRMQGIKSKMGQLTGEYYEAFEPCFLSN